jgi:formiminotetrahydrofolate cyclodeaminase
LSREGNPAVRGDAVVAAVLGGAGAEAAGALVRINLSEVPHDARLAEVAVLLDDAGKWVNQARSTH